MKKITLLFAMILVLVSSIVFCACGDGYKKLKIELIDIQYYSEEYYSEEGVINLVLDDSKLSRCGLIFELSGAKKWGDVNIDSNPSGVVKVLECDVDGKKCEVSIEALQPTEGASLVITHLGSGKELSIPLNIGMKLKSVESLGLDYIIEYPNFEEYNNQQQIFEIPTVSLLDCVPTNYTDIIVWQQSSANIVKGVSVVSFNAEGEQVDAINDVQVDVNNSDKLNGKSTAITTKIKIDSICDKNTTITLNPITILDGKAILHKDVVVNVCITELLTKSQLQEGITSETHGYDDEILHNLVLISNPGPKSPRKIDGYSGYDFYSTAIIDFKRAEENGQLQHINLINNKKMADLYEMKLSTDIDALSLEHMEFGKLRVIATSTCFGQGHITVRFEPKACVGDIETIEVSIPCAVGERATSFKSTNNGQDITINKSTDPEFDFESSTALSDSDSLGQQFRFEVLSVNTLDALKTYRININKNLLYINPKYKEEGLNSPYIKTSKDGDQLFELDEIENPYMYQISILKDGREVNFYQDGENFVSETLTHRNTIYIRWEKVDGKPIGSEFFGITISNDYSGNYQIKNHEFDKTLIDYRLSFDRQCTVETIEYVPVEVDISNGRYVHDADVQNDWQFYFERDTMLNQSTKFYGFKIIKVLGIGGVELTAEELQNINVEILSKVKGIDARSEGFNLGFAIFNDAEPSAYVQLTGDNAFNFIKDNNEFSNIILIGKMGVGEDLNGNGDLDAGEDVNNNGILDIELNYGDYQIEFSQINKIIDTRDVRVYQQLKDEDINVTIPTADFGGEVLDYQYISTEEKPKDWSSAEYYVLSGGKYIKVDTTTTEWDEKLLYYKKISRNILADYVLSTSNKYNVNIEIKNKDFVGFDSQTVKSSIIREDNEQTSIHLPDVINMLNENGSVITTGYRGTYHNGYHYVKLEYYINVNKYDYYKLSDEKDTKTKTIYLYIYEPITIATFNRTMLYKYDYNKIVNTELKDEFGKETLTININNNDADILNYVDIKWISTGGGATREVDNYDIENVATYKFGLQSTGDKISGQIIANIVQFGVQFPIYCAYETSNPVLSEWIELLTPINTFKSGGGYINLKVDDDPVKIDATTKSSKGDTTFKDVGYIVCGPTGYKLDGVATVNANGELEATSAGKAKLIIYAKDRFKDTEFSRVTNYFNYNEYLDSNAYIVIDIIVSDGSLNSPYLIASAKDFKGIADDIKNKNYDKHYALVSDIDLGGYALSFDAFSGRISSYQEYDGANNMFRVYGVILNKSNSTLFTSITSQEDDLPNLENIEWYVDINYNENESASSGDVLIGLVGENSGYIKNITISISGNININGHTRSYVIGSMVADNQGTIGVENTKLVGVQGIINVKNGQNSTIKLGGVVGQNSGTIIGANTQSKVGNSGEVEYDVYYDNQGAMSDIDLYVNTCESNLENAVGGVVGYNNKGIITNVYALGEVKGVYNVGGLIGKNTYNPDKIEYSIDVKHESGSITVDNISVNVDNFQINNSYSSGTVKGTDNVGGIVGYDYKGTYNKVYYEIYTAGNRVVGSSNVGGLIGYAENSLLKYCYANNFAWGYTDSVEVYDIIGIDNVGGLIGFVMSNEEVVEEEIQNYSEEIPVIINSASSVNIQSTGRTKTTAGLVGRFNGFGAVDVSYYYGLIDASYYDGLVNLYDKDQGSLQSDLIYNDNSYSITNHIVNSEQVFSKNTEIVIDKIDDGKQYIFGVNSEYNNGYPYIIYEDGTSLISIIPTVIQINKAFDTYYEDLYKINQKYGEYVKVNGVMEEYRGQEGLRYSLMADIINTESSNPNLSDYRKHALVLYYYGLSDMISEYALEDLYYLNTVDMHKIINDDGIIVLPKTFKRFNLRSSDNGVVKVLTGGRLLLQGEGQAIITIISTINPSATASFVVIVRSKVQQFGLYSNAHIRDEYNLKDQTISVVKNSSKIIYADYASKVVAQYGREYEYIQATNMGVKFTISVDGTIDGDVSKYITLNGGVAGEYYNDGCYYIPYGIPITISVHEYTEAKFNISATPYHIINYTSGDSTEQIKHKLEPISYFTTNFTVVTKKGASAVNTNKTHLEMMPADDATNLDVKITTDVDVDKLYFDVESIGGKDETLNPKNPNGDPIKFVKMLDITGFEINKDEGDKSYFNISALEFEEGDTFQDLQLSLKLNDKSYYVKDEFTLRITLYVFNGDQKIFTMVDIDVKPQSISSVIAHNYRISDENIFDDNGDAKELNINDSYQSNVIRPGSTNIITIDIAPNIAIYDYVEIVDITNEDKILFKQVKLQDDGTLKSFDTMDTWIDNGIKLQKLDIKTSKLYVIAKLPTKSQANITHTIMIATYNNNEVVDTTYLNLEAVMYPTVVATYIDVKGNKFEVDTREGKYKPDVNGKTQVVNLTDTNLALGVEASISVETYNIDAGSLQHNITITNNNGIDDYTNQYGSYVKLEDNGGGRYILRFDLSQQAHWMALQGKEINVNFTATKSLNGVTESCLATIRFNIKRFVIHGISMTHTSSQGDLYGDWGKEFTTRFYFDKTDISYYNNGYWKTKYELLTDAQLGNIQNEQLRNDMMKINTILTGFNNLSGSNVQIYLNDVPITGNIDKDYVKIKNEDNSFKITAQEPTENITDINDCKFIVKFKVEYNGVYPSLVEFTENDSVISKTFGFNISKETTPFEEYIDISSQEEFEDMLEGKYYQLTKDLIFSDYTPVNVAIGGFNGAGHTITFKDGQVVNNERQQGFNTAQLKQDFLVSDVNIGLFGVIAEDTIIQNLQVCYDDVVVNMQNTQQDVEQSSNNIYFGGIAGQNLGIITNVKVFGDFTLLAEDVSPDNIDCGGITASNGTSESTKVATITNSSVALNMSALALTGGVAGINYGKITNTNFSGNIASDGKNQYVASVATTGFVVQNMRNAYISLSYVQCELNDDKFNLHSVGRTAGFVLNNAGTINNCYINQTSLRSQGNIGGFIYQNSGAITNCYASVEMGNSVFYNEFIYDTTSAGNINNCYVFTDSNKNIDVEGLTRYNKIKLQDVDVFKNFIFADINQNNGVWKESTVGPQLPNAGFDSTEYDYRDVFNIYDVTTFEGWFGRFDDTKNNIIENEVFFRFVRDIDFEAEGLTINPTTTNKILMANIEGNDMTLKNYNIYRSRAEEVIDAIGLFAQIKDATVRNLTIQPASIKATTVVAVGALAGIIDGAQIYNITIDKENLLILGRNAVGGLAGIVKGGFEIVGINSNVSAFASYIHNTAQQYNLYMGKNVTGNMINSNINEVSYVGSVAGIVDAYDDSTMSYNNRNINSYYIIRDIVVQGDLIMIGETVGGAFGLVGERTLVKDVKYDLTADTRYQGVYVAGGLVGENRGIIQSSNIYTQTGDNMIMDTSSCFDNLARVNGGIVGVNIGGLIDNCTSDIKISSTKSLATVGGIVGRNIEGSIYSCTSSGLLNGFYVGGIAGTDYNYTSVTTANNVFGMATSQTSNVYKNIQNKVGYNANCLVNEKYTSEYKYYNNEISEKLLKQFIKQKNNYYQFNNNYISDNNKPLVNTYMIQGLIIGYTSDYYSVEKITDEDHFIDNNEIFKANLQTMNEIQKVDKYKFSKGGDKEFYAIDNIDSTSFGTNWDIIADDNKIMLLYVIAYESGSFEGWSANRGYESNQCIAISSTTLETVESQN